ncbi:MAG: DUF2442 domain-containing protein [Bacteroidales bacterium]
MKYLVAELMFRAVKAWYEDGKICLLLTDNKEIRFPVMLNSKLRGAPVDKVKKIELICNGTGLHWPDLDEDLSLTGIIEGRYGG